MELQLFGINHKTSDVSEREKFIINESNQILLDNHLKNAFSNKLESFFGISTCNRTEFYFVGDQNLSPKVFSINKEARPNSPSAVSPSLEAFFVTVEPAPEECDPENTTNP